MQVNGWVLGIGSAIALVSIAQAQIPKPANLDVSVQPQIVALQNSVAALQNVNKAQEIKILQLKGDLAKEQGDRAYLEKMFFLHYHTGNYSGEDMKLNTPTCPNATGGGFQCSQMKLPR